MNYDSITLPIPRIDYSESLYSHPDLYSSMSGFMTWCLQIYGYIKHRIDVMGP